MEDAAPLTCSPVDSGVFLAGNRLEVCEFQEPVMEVVEVEDAHEQKGSGDKNACEQLRYSELLQAEILKPVKETEQKQGPL